MVVGSTILGVAPMLVSGRVPISPRLPDDFSPETCRCHANQADQRRVVVAPRCRCWWCRWPLRSSLRFLRNMQGEKRDVFFMEKMYSRCITLKYIHRIFIYCIYFDVYNVCVYTYEYIYRSLFMYILNIYIYVYL